MYSGFQGNCFQRNAFQIIGSSSPIPTVAQTHGGFDERHYKKYREHLERLTRITSEDRKYPKRAVEAAEALQELPVETTEIQKLTEKPELKGTLRLTPEINYEVLNREIDLIRAYLDMVITHQNELDDEMAFLLMMQ